MIYLFSSHYDEIILVFFVQMKGFRLTGEKTFQNWHLYVSKHAMLALRCFEKENCLGLELLKEVLVERELINLLTGSADV